MFFFWLVIGAALGRISRGGSLLNLTLGCPVGQLLFARHSPINEVVVFFGTLPRVVRMNNL